MVKDGFAVTRGAIGFSARVGAFEFDSSVTATANTSAKTLIFIDTRHHNDQQGFNDSPTE